MKKSDLYALAEVGMRERVKNLQSDLMDWYREFPTLFSGPPQLPLRLELRNGASHDPSVILTTLPGGHPGSKAAQLLPLLVKNGPTRMVDVARMLGLRSSGSLSTVIGRHMKAGTIERVSSGTYAATKAGILAVQSGDRSAQREQAPTQAKKKKKASGYAVRTRERRAVSGAVLAALENGPLESHALRDLGLSTGAIGPLVRRGYIARTRGGAYKRTAKPYIVDDRKSAQP